jgi:hypothetical protein
MPGNAEMRQSVCDCEDSKFHVRTKYFDIRYHFVREIVASGSLDTEYVASGESLADMRMKALGRSTIANFREAGFERSTFSVRFRGCVRDKTYYA